MNVFEFAMKMEQDGKAYYEKMAEQTGNEVVKNVLLELAADEEKHYRIFKKFRDGDLSGLKDIQETGSVALTKAKNVFESISANQEFSFDSDVMSAWKEAQAIEKKSEDFYREKAGEETSEDIKKALKLIADEEARHWSLIEYVLQFMDHPRRWIADAEWRSIEG